MTEATVTQLKILVERAVRPVRASTSRKRKLREELLAHLTAVFDQEAKLGDENAALVRATSRFGNPADLTRQLQETVPGTDRLPRLIEELVGFPARESTLRRAVRHSAVVGGFCTVLVAIAFLALTNRSEWLTTARVPSLFASVTMAFLMFCGTLVTGAMRYALYGPNGRSWFLTGLVTVAAWLFVPALCFAFCLALSGNLGASLMDALPCVAVGVLAPVAVVLVVRASDPELRYYQEWASLPIDGGPSHA